MTDFVDIGTTPNDGTGDGARTAFGVINGVLTSQATAIAAALLKDGSVPLTSDWSVGSSAITSTGIINGGQLRAGADGVTAGVCRLYGQAAGFGGQLTLHTSDDHDSTYDSFTIGAYEDYVRFGPDINNTLGFYYKPSSSLWDFRDNDITTTGTVTIGAYTLPATDGTNGQVLQTNGSGVLSWVTP